MSARRINRMRNQGQGGGTHVHYVRADIVTQKRNERMVRDAYRREHKMSSYLADDENFPSFRNQLAKLGLELRDIPGDGNCLFRALGDQYEGHVRNHFRHRQDVVKYMTEHKHDFEPFLSDDTSFERHISGLQKLGTYAGNDAIVAFARLREVNVIIHQLSSPFLMIQGVKKSSPTTRQLHIAYHNGDHYSSVRKCNDNTESPTNIRLKIGEEELKTAQTDFASNVDDGVVRAVRDTVRLAEEVMNATGCTDEQRVLECLTDCDYDVDATIAYVLQTMETTQDFKDDTTSLASHMTSTDSGIWSESSTSPTKHEVKVVPLTNGSGSDVKGHGREDSYGGSSGYGSLNSQGGARPKVYSVQKVPVQSARLNNKQTKKMKKMEKKKRAEEKHKMKIQGVIPQNSVEDNDDVVTVVAKDLQMAKI